MVNETKNNFTGCSMAWGNLAIASDGAITPCCRFKQTPGFETPRIGDQPLNDVFFHPIFKKVREELDRGSFPPPCMICKQEEAVGLRSLRTKFFRYYPDWSREKLQALELFVGNECNMKCRMCGPVNSSLWARELLGAKELNASRALELLAGQDLRELRYIRFLGGETLMNRSFFSVLDLLHNAGIASKVVISLSSNGSIGPSSQIMDSLRRFKRVVIDFSLDGIGSVGQYIRQGVEWHRVASSVDEWLARCKGDTKFILSVHTTLQAMNFATIFDLIEFCMERDFYFWGYRQLTHPTHFQVGRLPLRVRKKIVEDWINHPRADEVKSYLERKAKPGSWDHLTKHILDLPELPLDIAIQNWEKYDALWGVSWRISLKRLSELVGPEKVNKSFIGADQPFL